MSRRMRCASDEEPRRSKYSPCVVVKLYTAMGGELRLELPAKYEVCGKCHGHGKHVNEAIDGNGITSSEWAEWDFEDRENYMGGVYDVTCTECHSKRVIAVLDEDAIKDQPRRRLGQYVTGKAHANLLERIWRQERDERAAEAEERAERRMGC